MIKKLVLRGRAASILWGYRTAASVRSWTVRKGENPNEWTLHAEIERVDRFQLRQRPLLFTAPRLGGFWCWPVTDVTVGAQTIRASLGPPEY